MKDMASKLNVLNEIRSSFLLLQSYPQRLVQTLGRGPISKHQIFQSKTGLRNSPAQVDLHEYFPSAIFSSFSVHDVLRTSCYSMERKGKCEQVLPQGQMLGEAVLRPQSQNKG